MQLGPHLHRIGNDIVAAYLVVVPEGITVIDAGLPGHWRDLRRELSAIGRPLDDIKGVILTHGDSDHLGFAERLRRDHGVPVHVHAADADRARGGDKPKTPMGVDASMAGHRILRIRAAQRRDAHHPRDRGRGRRRRRCARPSRRPSRDRAARTFSREHRVACARADAVFVGDALTTRSVLTGRPGIQPAPFTDEPDVALDSLDRLAGVEASWVLPGHGTPWRGSPADVAGRARAAAGSSKRA